MATASARFQAMSDALINKTATPAQMNRLGYALALRANRQAEYDAATSAQKTAFALGQGNNQDGCDPS